MFVTLFLSSVSLAQDTVDTDGVVEARLQNADIAVCGANASAVFPLSNEDGHRAASRLVPDQVPFVVESVGYELMDFASFGCDAGLAHTVEVWVESVDDAPSAQPEILETIQVAVPAEPLTRVELPLSRPITLTEGEALFVSVEMVHTGSSKVCLVSCRDGGTPEHSWWSNAAQPPYAWTTLATFWMPDQYTIHADGFTVPEQAW